MARLGDWLWWGGEHIGPGRRRSATQQDTIYGALSGFADRNIVGPTVLGLNVQGQDTASVPSFVGLDYQGAVALGKGMVFSPSLQIAYVHKFAPQRTQIGGCRAHLLRRRRAAGEQCRAGQGRRGNGDRPALGDRRHV